MVDDAGVETPGVCHLESWRTRLGPGRGLINLSPACTRVEWPRLEIGASLLHLEDSSDDTTVGPALKLNLVDQGVGFALTGTGGLSVRSGRLETATVTAPLTLPVSDGLRLNVNGGWAYTRAAAHRHQAFIGGQVEVQLSPEFSFMAEGFVRDRGFPGGQIGLRWTPPSGKFDVDILAGSRVDGVSRSAVTLGLTLRH